jgi:hypothetical protein
VFVLTIASTALASSCSYSNDVIPVHVTRNVISMLQATIIVEYKQTVILMQMNSLQKMPENFLRVFVARGKAFEASDFHFQ